MPDDITTNDNSPADQGATDAAGTPTDSAGGSAPGSTSAGDAGTEGDMWQGPFDADRAARLITRLRADREADRAKLRGLTEMTTRAEGAEARAAAAEERAAKLERDGWLAAAVQAHNLPADLVEYVTGTTAEEITASAERVAQRFGARPAGEVPGRPRARLVPGSGPDTDAPAFDAEKVAKAARRY